jgi:hypothetical protein
MGGARGPLQCEYNKRRDFPAIRPPSRGGIRGAMQSLDRDNAQFRRDPSEMRTATLGQRAGNDEANNALRTRARFDGAPRARA